MKMRFISQLAMLLVILATSLASAADAPRPSPQIEPALRNLWQRDEARFQRSWLVAGPMAPQRADALDLQKLQPAPGAPLAAEDGPRGLA